MRKGLAYEPAPEGARTHRIIPVTIPLRQLWVHTRLSRSASLAYNELFALRMLGNLDLEMMSKAIRQMVELHEALRTTFDDSGEHVRIASGVAVEVACIDEHERFASDPEATIAALLDNETEEPFDLVSGPLFRIRIYRLEESHHLFVLVFHHLIMDGFSVSVFLRQLRQFYNAAIDGRTYCPYT